MTDNGAAMLADETVTGLASLGIVHQTTLPYSPYQNAKQESFWGRVEGRLMAMLEGEETLSRLTCSIWQRKPGRSRNIIAPTTRKLGRHRWHTISPASTWRAHVPLPQCCLRRFASRSSAGNGV